MKKKFLINLWKILIKVEADKLNDQDKENNSEEDIFSQDFEKKIEDSILEYNKNNDKIFSNNQ